MRICKFKCTNCPGGKKYPCAVAIAEPTTTETDTVSEKRLKVTLGDRCLLYPHSYKAQWKRLEAKDPTVKDKARTKPMGRLEFYRKELHKFSSQLQPHMLEGGFIARAYREYLNSFREKNV
jgi:hypothetical protein